MYARLCVCFSARFVAFFFVQSFSFADIQIPLTAKIRARLCVCALPQFLCSGACIRLHLYFHIFVFACIGARVYMLCAAHLYLYGIFVWATMATAAAPPRATKKGEWEIFLIELGAPQRISAGTRVQRHIFQWAPPDRATPAMCAPCTHAPLHNWPTIFSILLYQASMCVCVCVCARIILF